jgi:hypothetical protein
MTPDRYKFQTWQGSTLLRTFELTTDEEPFDLDGMTARMEVRPSANSPDVILDVTDFIALGDGTIEIDVPADVMADVPAGSYVYDLELVEPGEPEKVSKLLEGSFVVRPEVTRGAEI